MNSFVLGFHPEGLSLVEHLAYEGFEVWTANLRGQGESRRIGGAKAHAFRELALVDLPRAIDVVLQETRTRASAAPGLRCVLCDGSAVRARERESG